MNGTSDKSISTPTPTRRLAIVDWSLLLAGISCLVMGAYRLAMGEAALATTGLGAGLILLLAATFERFESVKGLGIEAKARVLDQKISQADEVLKQLKTLAEVSGTGLLRVSAGVGRWDGHMTAKQAYELARQVRDILQSLGSEQSVISAALTPWAKMTAIELARGAIAPYYEALHTQAAYINSGAIEYGPAYAQGMMRELSIWELGTIAANLNRLAREAPDFVVEDVRLKFQSRVERWAPEIAHIESTLDFSDSTKMLNHFARLEQRKQGEEVG